MKLSPSVFAAATPVLLAMAAPSAILAQANTATTAATATTTTGGTSQNSAPGVPASGIVTQPQTTDVWRLRRLVRDVVSNTDNIRASGNFGAQLWLTENADFFQNWRKPDAPTINPVQIAQRGQAIYTVVIFYGEASTPSGQGNVSYDVSVLRPDGTSYDKRDAMIGFQNLAPADNRELQLGRNYLNITIGADDPAGLYTVNVTVHDNVSKVDLPLKQTFVVQ